MDSKNSIAQLPNILAGIRAGTNDLTIKDIDKGEGVEIAYRVEAAQNIARKAVDKIDRLEKELGKAYRAVFGFHNSAKDDEPLSAGAQAYHSLTCAAAKRFIDEGSFEGTEYFVGKPATELHKWL